MEPWSPTTVWLLLLTAILPHTLRGLLFLNDQNFVMTINWLQVFRRADATLLGSDRRQLHQMRAVR